MEAIFKKATHGIGSVFGGNRHSHSHLNYVCDHLHADHATNRFQSFAPPSTGNVKWFVDGCSYFWAVSEALESKPKLHPVKYRIFLTWLSPEVYLRRPPSKNEKYRLDRMLQAAAARGVKVCVIVYKEVEAALSLNSTHTKHSLEALHPNISVLRHPDHTPTGYDVTSELGRNMSDVTHFDLAKASKDAVTALYGSAGDVVLFWAHHEKLVVIDRKLCFMGGLDLCFGRWDTNSHPIADAHPGSDDATIFPGQDYNNARVFDFADVGEWSNNKLERSRHSRMGWSDVALSLDGPITDSLIAHFVDRWNFIYNQKYKTKTLSRYVKLAGSGAATAGQMVKDTTGQYLGGFMESIGSLITNGNGIGSQPNGGQPTPRIQLTRSCSPWSSGHDTEHSIANAYVHTITNATHFVYIENQFFITATSDEQQPIVNKIGAAIIDRILRAHKEKSEFMIWVVMPAVPAFAGNLKADDALGTRAIMEFQYKSICRGGHSIIEKLQQGGIKDVGKYIGFYNLRNFDRINALKTVPAVERHPGVVNEDGRKQRTAHVNAAKHSQGKPVKAPLGEYEAYKKESTNITNTAFDTISSCYMGDSHSVADLPWDGEPDDEIDSFVSEELYIHSKLLIADDRIVICGSANLNDRSQLGSHDSEIAVVIEDMQPVDSLMNGQPYKVARFATSLRRQIFRKHLGLLKDQRWDQPDENWHPVNQCSNEYDWGSPADILVRDPMHTNLQNLWMKTAETNTEVFRRAFHPVPDDRVRTWAEYTKFFEKYFIVPSEKKHGQTNDAGKAHYGHIVRKEFPGGVEEVKTWLSRIRGTVVTMPLNFLAGVDNMAKQGMSFNGLTEIIYT